MMRSEMEVKVTEVIYRETGELVTPDCRLVSLVTDSLERISLIQALEDAVGNENPEIIKTANWMRAMTNQLPKNLAAQGWNWAINTFDDDTSVIGVTTVGNVVQLIPGTNNPSGVLGLEYSPSKFVFGSMPAVKGRRFQIKTNFPSTPGFYELRGFQFAYRNEAAC